MIYCWLRVMRRSFGIARLPSSQLTFADQILGTTNYMSPEVLRVYDAVGMMALFAFVLWGGRFLWMLIAPVLGILFGILARIHG